LIIRLSLRFSGFAYHDFVIKFFFSKFYLYLKFTNDEIPELCFFNPGNHPGFKPLGFKGLSLTFKFNLMHAINFHEGRPAVINAFGLPIFQIKDILADPEIVAVIKETCRNVFSYLGIADGKSDAVIAECLRFAGSYSKVTAYEEYAHTLLAKEGIIEAIPEKLADRARIMDEQIRPHLSAVSVLDLGCGDARLAQLLVQDGFTLQLADVYEHSNVAGTCLPFHLIKQSEVIPFEDNRFDNTLLLTVLHHSDDPLQVIGEAHRVTHPGGRVIVIESVYGVDGKELSPLRRAQIRQYLDISPEQQRKVNIFFDHFYNRVIHYATDPSQKVNVPFNFNTPELWKILFEKMGFKQERIVHLGVDQPVVPEYHTLHVLTVIK
jgi:SAM-dependent methyltransferase